MPEQGRDETKAPFNMALNTLERIGDILREIQKVSANSEISPAQKQFIIVPLIQQLFFQASPLLNEEIVKKYKDKVINLKAKQLEKGILRYGRIVRKEVVLYFDLELDKTLNILLIDIQRELQKEKYFMPPKKDLSRAVTEM